MVRYTGPVNMYYDLGGGSFPPGVTPPDRVTPGNLIPQPPVPELYGYIFDAWYMDAAKSVLADFSILTASTNPLTIYAGWFPFSHPEIPLPPDPELEHHAFMGWYYDENYTLPYDGKPIYEHTELYAKFVPLIYHISFVTGVPALTYSDMNVTALTAAGTLPASARKGYEFAGWYLDAELTVLYEPIPSMTGNITLYAGFEGIVFTVTFYVKGAVYATLTVPYGTTLYEAVSSAAAQQYGNGLAPTVVTGMYSDSNLYNTLGVNTVITTDMNVYAEVLPQVLPHGSAVGKWFNRNWPYFPVAAGCFGAGMLTLLVVLKKRGEV